jgi:hypothetical protein
MLRKKKSARGFLPYKIMLKIEDEKIDPGE